MKLNVNYYDLAEEFAKEHSLSKFKFDFSEESIRDLDDFIEELRGHYLIKKEVSFAVKMILGCAGFYLGEVIKKNINADWLLEDESIIMDAGQFRFNPIGKVYKRFIQGAEDSVYGFYLICINNDIITNSLKA